ncbi:MAG: DUF3332 family protein [Deltaproteobacteria bacterium]|nr:DUF3332 family protein [Deltaproteobacteria bacterium]
MNRKLCAGVLAAALGASGCYGSFAAVRRVHDFNGGITDSKFVHTLVMYALVIFPAYSIAIWVDVVILNVIEFWTDNNPLARAPASADTRLASVDEPAGGVTLTRGGHRYTLRPEADGTLAVMVDGKLVGHAVVRADGGVDLFAADGTALRSVDGDTVAAAGRAVAVR